MSRRELLLKVLLPLIILLLGAGVAIMMITLREPPHPEKTEFAGPLVDVAQVSREFRQVTVRGTGTVQARYQTDVTPQVSGRVDWISPKMVAGGIFHAGETLFTIEAIDYELALERARANLAQAELELMQIESRAEIARQEWVRLQMEDVDEPNPLVLYEPQMKSAKAVLASAGAAVRQAELDLARTRLSAPFNCYVREERVDVGQYLRAGNSVATLAGTDSVEIIVPLPLEELAWLELPRDDEATSGSPATVQLELGEHQLSWQGEIVRSLGDIDPNNRMAGVVVSVEDPFGQQTDRVVELAPGMFVEVTLHGKSLGDVIVLPRGALRDADTVWVVDEAKRLDIRQVEIVRRERTEVLIGSGLEDGDLVVMSGVSGAAEGLQLRPQLREAD